MFENFNTFSLTALDLQAKVLLPIKTFYQEAIFEFNALYQDIRNVLIENYGVISTTAKQLYRHPKQTLSVWYEHAQTASQYFYQQTQQSLLTTYQDWQLSFSVSKDKSIQYLQSSWHDTEQFGINSLQSITQLGKQTEQLWQAFISNPEQFMLGIITPLVQYMNNLTDETEAKLISSYYLLIEFFNVLTSKSLSVLQNVYKDSLASVLNIYSDVIGSLVLIS
ncbi:MAG: hypothetical protein WAX77_06775 [Methylococcaceae bacterium]